MRKRRSDSWYHISASLASASACASVGATYTCRDTPQRPSRLATSSALRPAFSQALTYVSRLRASCSGPPRRSEFSIGTPRSAVASIVSGLVHTTYTRGGGGGPGVWVNPGPRECEGACLHTGGRAGPPLCEGPREHPQHRPRV